MRKLIVPMLLAAITVCSLIECANAKTAHIHINVQGDSNRINIYKSALLKELQSIGSISFVKDKYDSDFAFYIIVDKCIGETDEVCGILISSVAEARQSDGPFTLLLRHDAVVIPRGMEEFYAKVYISGIHTEYISDFINQGNK